jgi:surfeit locus 1 family protein
MTFRPYPGFTIFAVISIALLCGLGVWQSLRLPQKLEKIARLQHGLAAPAEPIETVWPRAQGMDIAAKLDYRKVSVRGHFSSERQLYFFATGANGQPEYHVLAPFITAGSDRLLVDRGLAKPGASLQGGTPPPQGERTIIGILRQPSAPNWFTPKSDPVHGITYTRDPGSISAAFGMAKLMPMFLEADAAPNPGGWPKGGQTVVDLPNNHLSYAVTWFGLALGMLCIWFSYNFSRGRIRFK